MAKAIASGDSRLMQKAGLESEIARLQRQRAAHVDDQHAIRRQIHDARRDQAHAERASGRSPPTSPGASRRAASSSAWRSRAGRLTQRKAAGASLLTKIRLAARERADALDGRPHRRLRPDLRVAWPA